MDWIKVYFIVIHLVGLLHNLREEKKDLVVIGQVIYLPIIGRMLGWW